MSDTPETRICVTCGRSFPASQRRDEPGAGCPEPELCSIDMTASEAVQHWRQLWHDDRENWNTRIAKLEAERDRLRELIFGADINLWDRAEFSERDEAGNQTILLWHPSGQPVATLRVDKIAPGLTGLHVELLMSDLLDVFVARERARAALNKGGER